MLAQETSINDIKIDSPGKEKTNPSTPTPIHMASINQLELVVNTNNVEDLQQISKVLKQILMYPDEENTVLHTLAMQLGNFDLQDQLPPPKQRLDTSAGMLNQPAKKEFCPCCGFKIQQKNIGLCHPFDKIKNMGLSTFLFFATFKNLSILLSIMLIIYSGYSLATNVLAANLLSTTGVVNYSKIDYINISLSSKQTNDTTTNRLYYYISCWFGVAMAIIWLLIIFCIKYNQIKDSNQYDQDTISCSDYSVVIQGVPLNVNHEQLQKQFTQYFQTTIKNSTRFPQIWKNPLKIMKVNVAKPFYLHEDELKDQEIEQIDKELQQIKEKLAEWIIQRRSSGQFRVPKGQRDTTYQRYAKLVQSRNKKCLQISNKVASILKKDNGERQDLTNVFVTFEINNNKTILNFIHDSGILSRIRGLCNAEHQRFTYKQDGKEYLVHLTRAPEPEDIIWTNIGQRKFTTYMKKFFTFSITVILLGISFAIVFGLTKLQQSKNDDRMVSIAISLTIGIVNALIGQVIRKLTVFEKDYTETERQASLSIKSILAQMVNSIIIPVITAYYIKGNLYQASGLVDNIFMLSITTSIVPPILVFIDPGNIIMKIIRCIKSRPTSKLYQTQKEHNSLHQGLQFQVGFHYIYPVNVFIFTCYFVSLQPIVAFIALVGYFLMYWAQKYCLFNRYRRPVPGTDFVNNAVYRIILLGPLVFGLGSLTWSNFTPGGIPPEALLPNLVIVGISLIIFLIPYHTVMMGSCFANNYERNKMYDQERIIFPSQYDRLNPFTQQEGIEDYKKYLQRKLKEIQQLSQEKQAQFAQKFMMNAQRAQAMQRGVNNNFGNVQGYMPMQMMQPYQQYPQMGFSPFTAGFNIGSLGLMSGMPFAPNMPYQQYPQMRPQPRPMVPQAYPSPGVVMPPPVVYPPQAQLNVNAQSRPNIYRQPMVATPMYNNNPQMLHPNAQRSGLPQQPMNPPLNPAALLNNHGVTMNLSQSNSNLGVRPVQGNQGQNRGWG